MTPYEQFEANLDGSSSYVRMYEELRELKQLGQRGSLSARNRYLLWLPRAAVVSSIGALDQYCHQVLYTRVPQILQRAREHVSDSLCELIARAAPIRKSHEVRDQMPLIRRKDGWKILAERLNEKIFRFESYQAPDKVQAAFKHIGHDDIFQEVTGWWQGPNTDRANITRRLNNYVIRRNQIAHEGDLDHNKNPRPVTPAYARNCIGFIESLVWRIDGAVFGWRSEQP